MSPIVRLGHLHSFDSVSYFGQLMSGRIERRVTEVIIDRTANAPVVALQGPRTVGKSTVLNQPPGSMARRSSTSICPTFVTP